MRRHHPVIGHHPGIHGQYRLAILIVVTELCHRPAAGGVPKGAHPRQVQVPGKRAGNGAALQVIHLSAHKPQITDPHLPHNPGCRIKLRRRCAARQGGLIGKYHVPIGINGDDRPFRMISRNHNIPMADQFLDLKGILIAHARPAV